MIPDTSLAHGTLGSFRALIGAMGWFYRISLVVIGYWLLVIGYWLLVAGYWLLGASKNSKFTALAN
jgi:hypothetical protein